MIAEHTVCFPFLPPEAVDIICIADGILYTDGRKHRSLSSLLNDVSLTLSFLFCFLVCAAMIHYLYTRHQTHDGTRTQTHTHDSIGSSDSESNIASAV